MADEKRRYVGASLTDEVWYALVKMATTTGRHPTNLIEEYIERGLALDTEYMMSENPEVPIELKVFKTLQSVRSTTNIHVMLKQIASSLLASPDENQADHVKDLCEVAGISFEQLMKEVEDGSMSVKSAISFDDDHSLAHAKAWLMTVFKDKVEIPANIIYEEALKQGYSKAVLRNAKDSLGILAVRRPKCWMWSMPTFLSIPAMTEVSHGK